MSAPRQIPELVPGSTEWLTYMSASKIAAVVGLSPYTSKYALWCLMAGRTPAPETNNAMRRGLYLEDGVAAWYGDQHPDYDLKPGGTWLHGSLSWATANPDRLIHVDGQLAGICQVKTTGDWDEWGAAGTEEIPIGYRAQVMWEMEVLQVPWCDIAVLLPGLSFRQYRIAYDPAEAAALVTAAGAFMDSLDWGEAPQLDGDDATYEAVRKQHPDIDEGVDCDLTPQEAARFVAARQAVDAAAEGWNLARARMCERMGRAKYATYLGDRLACRKAKNGGTPWVESAKTLPDMSGIELEDENR